jgi:hypothetical protein
MTVTTNNPSPRSLSSLPMSSPSIEDVEGRLSAFQERLLQYGKDIFGEDFVVAALADEVGAATVGTVGTTATRAATAALPATCQDRLKQQKREDNAKEKDRKRKNAKSVLQRFLEDREELVRLRVIARAAQERLHSRIGAAEGHVKRVQALLEESERRRKADVQSSQAFLTELRKKLTSVERKQSRLVALMTRPDDEILDRVLERQAKKEAVEVGVAPRSLELVDTYDDGQFNLEDTLSQLSLELKEIEKSMAVFNAQ